MDGHPLVDEFGQPGRVAGVVVGTDRRQPDRPEVDADNCCSYVCKEVPPAADCVPVLGAVKIVRPVGRCILTAPARRRVGLVAEPGGYAAASQVR